MIAVNLTTGTKTADATSATTGSFTPPPNALILFTVASKTEITANPNQPTITGNGLTYVVVNTKIYDDTSSSRRRITTFRAMGGSPTAGTAVIDFGGQTQVTVAWVVDYVSSGVNMTGTNGSGAVVQSAIGYNDTSSPNTSVTATMLPFTLPNNASYGAFANGNDASSVTAGSGFTKVGEAVDTVEHNLDLYTEFKNSPDTSIDVTFSSDPENAIIGLEIAADHNAPINLNYLSNRIRPRPFGPGLAR